MADYNNTIFKPRKDSGFVVKVREAFNMLDELAVALKQRCK